jgi:GTP-binding protein EngB required for normal cell division
MDLLDKAAMSYQVVLTKTDKIKAAGVPRLISETLAASSSAGRRPIRRCLPPRRKRAKALTS